MGEPLVFLPGLLCDARLFYPQIEAFSARHPVMVVPCRGFDDLVRMADAVIDALPARAAVVGHGLGAAVAVQVARRAPERVTRLALIAVPPLAETPAIAAARDLRVARARAGRIEQALAEEIPPDCLAPGPGRAALRPLMLAMAEAVGADTYALQARAMQRRPDPQGALRRLRCPALVIGGVADTVAPPRRQAFVAELLHGAPFLEVPQAGHLPTLETPDAVTAALADWLDAGRADAKP